jgi:glucose/arabinose dehydrogenase
MNFKDLLLFKGFWLRKAYAAGAGKFIFVFSMIFLFSGCEFFRDIIVDPVKPKNRFPMVKIPNGYQLEKVVDGLDFPTSVTWDNQGEMYVAEAGGGLGFKKGSMRIMHVKDGMAKEAVNFSNKPGFEVALVGLTWHDGAFYVTHRAENGTGAASRVTKGGEVESLFEGIIDSKAEHQINDIRMAPDGRMYVAVGLAGNAGVMDATALNPQYPDARSTPCQDIVLIGKNFKSANILTEEKGDSVLTGAFVPFGTETKPGEVIKGVTLCGGSILSFDPKDPMGTIKTHAWGFRNLIGLAWDHKTGEMYAAENGYDIRGSRPVKGEIDATLKVKEGMWYGVPDFSASRKPLTNPEFEVPDKFQAPIYINGEFVGKDLGFLIDHEASGLTPPDPSLVVGHHVVHSSPTLLDVAPEAWGDWAGNLFIAEWGDLTPPTDPLRPELTSGVQVVRVNPDTRQLEPFVRNVQPQPAHQQGLDGKALNHPFDVKFGPDGAMYIVDYGAVEVDPSSSGSPYNPILGTGVIWKVSKIKE